MTDLLVRQPARSPGPGIASWLRRLLHRAGGPRAVVAIAFGAGLLWLPDLARPLSPDEGGFLMVASQWSLGDSLYGNYWVDRPPLLIGIFQLADLGGGVVALRLLGLTAVVLAVLLAGRIGALAVPHPSRRAPALVAATGAVFVATPLFGASEVDGELLAVPFVLASIACSLLALRTTSPEGPPARPGSWWALSGATAVAGMLVKQSMIDGFVLAATVVLWLVLHARTREAARAASSFGLGAVGLLGSVLAWAAARGTDPLGLWRAVVVFRADAAAVISAQANAATPARALHLLASFLLSGAVVVILAALVPRLGRERRGSASRTVGDRPDVRLLAAVVLAWEAVAVVSGGSYWLHYLIGLVPGLVLAAAVAAHRPARARWVTAGLGYAAVAALVSTVGLAAHDGDVTPGVAVAGYLGDHARASDTGVVAFGDPAILETAGLTSPYPQLWSLPVRVLDPHLAQFTGVITGPARPVWVVVDGTSLATWGVDARRAQQVFDREYRLVDVEGDYHVYRLRRPFGTA